MTDELTDEQLKSLRPAKKRRRDAAMGDLGYERIAADFYPTEEQWTKRLVPYLKTKIGPDDIIWECAAGAGDMSDVLIGAGFRVLATDLHDRNHPLIWSGMDFLKEKELPSDPNFGCVGGRKVRAIVTNPPYSHAKEFLLHAIELTRPAEGIVCMYLRNEYDTAKGRMGLFNKPPFAAKIVTCGRPRWIKGSKGGPRHTYAWYVFDHRHQGPAQIFYA